MGKNRLLTKLPKKENGDLNYRSIIGMNLELLYNDNIYNTKVIGLTRIRGEKRFLINYNGYVYDKGISIDSLIKNARYDAILGFRGKFRLNKGDIINDNDRNIEIIGLLKYDRKYYRYRCNKCGYEGESSESNIINNKSGCLICEGKRSPAVLGINTIWDTDRWMCDLGVSEEDAKRYTKGSNKKIEVICPNCNNKKQSPINSIYNNKSIGCVCGDGFSYPEKFLFSLLNQLNVNFETQLSKTTFRWCDKYRYDFYLPEYNMIIETHGMQHYEETGRKGARTLEEEQENDRCKERLAKENGIVNYIELDCRHSNLEYIKNSILNSDLSKLFDLSKIDWLKCEEFSLKNIVKEVCDYWNNKDEWETAASLSNVLRYNRATIVRMLKKGSKLGWCSYDATKEKMKSDKKMSKKVIVEKEGLRSIIFNSSRELAMNGESIFGVKFNQSNISDFLNGKYKKTNYKGFTIKYIENNEQIVS